MKVIIIIFFVLSFFPTNAQKYSMRRTELTYWKEVYGFINQEHKDESFYDYKVVTYLVPLFLDTNYRETIYFYTHKNNFCKENINKRLDIIFQEEAYKNMYTLKKSKKFFSSHDIFFMNKQIRKWNPFYLDTVELLKYNIPFTHLPSIKNKKDLHQYYASIKFKRWQYWDTSFIYNKKKNYTASQE